MKKYTLYLFSLLMICINTYAQDNIDLNDYQSFLEANTEMTVEDLKEAYPLKGNYYKGFEEEFKVADYAFLDSIILKYGLTQDELGLLEENRFMVTERMQHGSFGSALMNIYHKDMPVMVTTDMLFHALHKSYDDLLITVEKRVMHTNLEALLEAMYAQYPSLLDKYGQKKSEMLTIALEDADIYTTIALSLVKGEVQQPQFVDPAFINGLWNGIQSLEAGSYTVFGRTSELRDFSQFKPRGHYEGDEQLEKYFQTMMWLGRLGFNVSEPINSEEKKIKVQQANVSSFMVQELLSLSGEKDKLDQNNEIIDYFVGDSDNLTTTEYAAFIESQNITDASQLLNEATFDPYFEALSSNEAYQSRILSSIILKSPGAPQVELPIEYKLSGQRFILDSYIMGNLVYDKTATKRMMPDPLDPLIVLGNNDAIRLLEDEIEQYNYAGNIASMSYVVERKDPAYWKETLYGTWLNSIAEVGKPTPDQWNAFPPFMQTAAWQQEKINTQLFSWTQLRHDNLLYAKQSYTVGIICSYPQVYIEPYPSFYRGLADFATGMANFFEGQPYADQLGRVTSFWTNFAETSQVLEDLAQKQLNKEPFTDEEFDFVRRIIYDVPQGCTTTYDGWYIKLFYGGPDKAIEDDFITVDVHTQPTDEFGNPVGNIMHLGTGKVNIGVFLAPHPSCDGAYTAFLGPVGSFYEYVQGNFERATNQEWEQKFRDDALPERPDWVNIYLADENGAKRPSGRELPAQRFDRTTGVASSHPFDAQWELAPNPVSKSLTITWDLPSSTNTTSIKLYNIHGQLQKNIPTLSNSGQLQMNVQDLLPGIYICSLEVGAITSTKRVIVVQ